jgi:hypothetical protein
LEQFAQLAHLRFAKPRCPLALEVGDHRARDRVDLATAVNLWPSKDGSESAAADSRRIACIHDVELTPHQQRKEQHFPSCREPACCTRAA